MTKLSLIVAYSDNRVIGINNQLPWHLPKDLKHFKATTMGKPIIMGRKTYESIGKPLPGRQNIVITRQADYVATGCDVCHSLQAALDVAGEVEEVIVIGGAAIYTLALPLASMIYLTQVHTELAGDVFFPPFDENDWQEISSEKHEADNKHAHAFTFKTFKRT